MNSMEFATKMGSAVYNLEFTKLDGAIRKMIATRIADKIPADHAPETAREIVEGKAVPVFDLEVCGWRSVRPDSVTKMEIAE